MDLPGAARSRILLSPADIQTEKAWLSTIVTRLYLDKLNSARVQREQYLGPWLPEPIRTEERVDPESISMAFLVLLEQLRLVKKDKPDRHHRLASPHRWLERLRVTP